MKILFSFLFVFTVLFSVAADKKEHPADDAAKTVSVSVFGNVTDANTGETLVGVQVQLEGTDKKVYTDFDGNFSFEDVTPGEYNISADYISYEHKKVEKQIIDIFSAEVKLKLVPAN